MQTLEQMMVVQDGRCAICQASFDDVRPCVDHDHETGVIRQLLCNLCNLGLGHFRDRPDLLSRAAEYLQKHGRAAA